MSRAALIGSALLLLLIASCGGERTVSRNVIEPLPRGLSVAFSSKFVLPGAGAERLVTHTAIACEAGVGKDDAVRLLAQQLQTRGFSTTSSSASDIWRSGDGSVLVSLQSVAEFLSESAEPGSFEFYEMVRSQREASVCAVVVLSPS